MSKKITKKEEVKSIIPQSESATWGATTSDSEDIIIPKAMLMQAMSEFVSEGQAKVGDFVDSTNVDDVLAAQGETFEAIFFKLEKRIMVFEDDKYAFMEDYKTGYEREILTANKVVQRRSPLMTFYFLRPSDIAAGTAFPYALSFKSTSLRSGKMLVTMFKRLEATNLRSANKVFTVGTKKEKNDKGTWFVPTTAIGRDTTQEELNTAYQWFKTLESKNVQVAEEQDISKVVNVIENDGSDMMAGI